MAIVQLMGRETYPNRRPYGYGISPLWQRVPPPPWQESIIVYNDGSVVRGFGFENSVISDPSVKLFILGGTQFNCPEGSEIYNQLTAAGFTWRPFPDSYPADYTEYYP